MRTSFSESIVSPKPLKANENSWPNHNEVLENITPRDSAIDMIAGANFWHQEIGVNVIPAVSKIKQPNIQAWKPFQDSPNSDEQHNSWIKGGLFDSGMAVITGKIWRGANEGKYLICIDCDNQHGIDEFLENCFPGKTLEDLSHYTIIEQHLDNREKAHIYLIVEKPLKNRAGIAGSKTKELSIPIVEVKSEGKAYVVCSPSIHKNGYRYQIIGTRSPACLDLDQTEILEKSLAQIYEKYDDTGNKTTGGKIPIDDLYKEDFIAYEGSRSTSILRYMTSYMRRNKDRSYKDLKGYFYSWNQYHCKPPLGDKKFNDQLKCAIGYVEKDPSVSQDLVNGTNFISKKIRDSPEVYYYSDSYRKRIGQYYMKNINKENKKEPSYIPQFTEIIIDAYPKKINIYKNNPLVNTKTERTKIIFESSSADEEIDIGPYDDTEMILKELENRHLVINRRNAKDALSCIINAFKERKLVETHDDIITPGYYFLGGNLKMVKPTQKLDSQPDKNKVIRCIDFLDYLATKGWKNKNIFPTVLKWGLIAPFSFSIKFASDSWLPWLQLYGCGQTGKTTIGQLVLHIWNQDKRVKSIGFNNIDSVARFGHTISKDTYPILVNEVGSLSTNNYSGKQVSIIETIKHSVESITCRGKYFEGKNYQEIAALSSMILTSNYSPPNDGSYNRRFISIHFPEEEKKEKEGQEEFKKLMAENKDCLSILGDYTASYIIDDPSILVTKEWTDISKNILISFWRLVGKEAPSWLDFFEEQRDAVDESSEKMVFELRAFLLSTVNEAFNRNRQFGEPSIHPSKDLEMTDKLHYCLKNMLVPFISQTKDSKIIITVDIMKELKKNQSIENLSSLKDLGAQLGFEYSNKYVNGKRMRVLEGTRDVFVKFMEPIME